MTTIALFTTYAPSEGFGGPARAFHQRQVLEQAGHQVVHVVIQSGTDRGASRPSDLVEYVERPWRADIDHIYNDVDLATRARQNPRLVRRVTGHLRTRGVDAIILEQPFLVDLVADVANALNVPVVYSCQNIEYVLRRDLERFAVDSSRAPERFEEVRQLEVKAFDLATAVTAICQSDQVKIRQEFGSDSILVPNGSTISSLPRPPGDTRPSGDWFSFTGSAYWPNIEGFVEIATPSLAFLPPTTTIRVGGTVGPELLRQRSIDRRQSINASRLRIHGFVAMSRLVPMMHFSRAVIVPVFIGEGSNLKSADALASGAPVIMTRRATMGYEDVIQEDDEGITVVDTAQDFRIAMRDALSSPRRQLGEHRRTLLRWSTRLKPMVDTIESIT